MARKTTPKPATEPSGGATEAPMSSDRVDIKKPIDQASIYKKSEDFKTIYANSMRIGVTQWDVTLILGLLTDGEAGEAVVEERISIKLSPQYFKALAGSCQAAITQWEDTFGALNAGPGQNSNTRGLKDVFGELAKRLVDAEGAPVGPSD